MSWLRQGLTQSVTGKISQISGQLKDILIEGTEEVVDPSSELQVKESQLKEYERHMEMLKSESSRWQNEASELNVKCGSYEAQLEQKQNEFRRVLTQKDAELAELRNKITSLQNQFDSSASMKNQKSALMEEFEDLMPQSEFSDYLNMQKEIKRLNEDNLHLANENKQLLNRLKNLESKEGSPFLIDANINMPIDSGQVDQLTTTINELQQEIFSLKSRLETDKDKHQEEIIAIQNSYKDRVSFQLSEKQEEIDSLKKQLNETREKLEEKSSSSVSKSNDGWCINGDELNLDFEQTDKKTEQSYIDEISKLKNQIEMFESELEQANSLILKLKNNKQRSKSKEKKSGNNSVSISTQTTTIQEFNIKHKEETSILNKKLDELTSELSVQKALLDEKNKCVQEQEKEIDALQLELKQAQQSINQEKLFQMQEQKQEKQELAKLKTENTDLKIKLDEKLSEIKLLGDQINDLNANLNSLKSNDSTLFTELKKKTQQFLTELDSSNSIIEQLKQEKENLIEQRKQFEYVLEEKTRECSQLKIDIQKHLQHIAAQSKALEKSQEDLKKMENKEEVNPNKNEAEENEEFMFLKQQYNQIYGYLEQKNQESLNYYNEIQRLNLILSDLNRELQNSKNLNENLSEQYENLVKEFQLEQKMVEDLNQQTFELNKTLLSTTSAVNDLNNENEKSGQFYSDDTILDKDKIKKEVEEDFLKVEKERLLEQEEKNKQIIEQMQFQIDQLIEQKESIISQSKLDLDELTKKLNEAIAAYETNSAHIGELNLRLSQMNEYYENKLREKEEQLMQTKSTDDQQNQRLVKELERLREHLVEMSDNYNKDAIQAEEREKQLRMALNDAQKNIQMQDENLETTNKELDQKLDQFSQANQDLKKEKDKLKEQLKQTEDALNHQTKVTKNLELVLERLQREQDSQHSSEISKYQQTIKEHASKIHNLQKEAKNYQKTIDELNETLDSALLLENQLNEKETSIAQLKAQLGTKDSLIESLEKSINEIQKVNDSFIEKDIIKSLIIGYIKVNQAQEKKQAIKLISTMLNFSPSELDQVESASETKWFGGLLKTSPQNNKTIQQGKVSNQLLDAAASVASPNRSFTELLIQYVDRESKPKPNLTFDLDNKDSTATNKKTDSPLVFENRLTTASGQNQSNAASALLANNSASAMKFFTASSLNANNSNVSNENDLTLFNRNQSTNQVTTTSATTAANQLIEQILK